jgi:hypothetical protein
MSHRNSEKADQLPPRPITFFTESDIGRRRPRLLDKYGHPSAGEHVCTVEWLGGLLSDGARESYIICAGSEYWSLWIIGFKSSPRAQERDMLLAHGPRTAASLLEAATYLLIDYWRDIDDIYSTIENAGLLSERQIEIAAGLAWPHRQRDA